MSLPSLSSTAQQVIQDVVEARFWVWCTSTGALHLVLILSPLVIRVYVTVTVVREARGLDL